MVINIQVRFKKVKKMVMVNIYINKVIFIKDSGKMVFNKEKVNINIKMVIFIKVIGLMV